MQQTLTEIVDAGLEAIIQRNFTLVGGASADQFGAFITLIGAYGSVPNTLMELSTSLYGLGGNDVLRTVIHLQNENNYDLGKNFSPEIVTSSSNGGNGNDSIISTINLRYYWGEVTNQATGGDGDDVIRLTVQIASFDDAQGGQRVQSIADGGAGNDVIVLRTIMAEWEWTNEPLSHVIHGGGGNDSITSFIKATSNSGDSASVVIFGDGGSDSIQAFMQLDEGVSYGVTMINGGSGNDVIFAEVFNAFAPYEGYTIVAELFGNGGNDHITSLLHMADLDNDLPAIEFNVTLSGGGAADTLISLGGDARNHNIFYGGSGNDTMYGDGSVDEFLFVAAANQGLDVIYNWDGSMDQLNISALSNAQIDAISTIASVGPDVVLTLDSGTVITFKNVGIAGVDSVSDLF